MYLIENSIHFGHKEDYLSIREVKKMLDEKLFVFNKKLVKERDIEESVYKFNNKIPVTIYCVQDLNNAKKYHIVKGGEDIINLLTFMESALAVKIGDNFITGDDCTEFFLDLSFVNVTYIILNDYIEKEDYLKVLEELSNLL